MALLVTVACSDQAVPEPTPPPEATAEDWCEHLVAGPAGTQPGPLAWSEAHAVMRFFAVGSSYSEADLALTLALDGDTADWEAATLRYAELLQPVCALDAASQPLPTARVEEVGGLAIIHPGTGELVLPGSAQAVAIDLRGLPAAPQLEQALARAVAVASSQPIPRVSSRLRVHEGMTDERSATGNVYSNDFVKKPAQPFAPAGTRQLPVALLTGSTLAPAAARFAVDLRMAQRAWIFGEPVPTAVAEYRWSPIGARGLAIRTEVLVDDQGTVPDIIAADRPLGDNVESSLAGLADLGVPPSVDRGAERQRPTLVRRKGSEDMVPPFELSPGVARADLLTIHGALRRFFPYFPVVGDGIDERLRDSLAAVDAGPLDWRRLKDVLQRFSEVLHDGHATVSVRQVPTAGFFLVHLESVGGEVVVRRSVLPEVHAGDTLVSVNGRPMAEWIAEELPRTSAATAGHQRSRVLDRLTWLDGPTVFGIRAPDGTPRPVAVMPRSSVDLLAFGSAPTLRQAGRLGDLGAPELGYVNMADTVSSDLEAFRQAVATMEDAEGLIVDMRGYPGFNPYPALQHLIPETFSTPLFRIPTWVGPDIQRVTAEPHQLEPAEKPLFRGPIVLLVSPATVSAAETFSMTLVGAHRVKVVGRRSAGTNGNITRLWLPGGVLFLFTGMETLFPDGSRFHGLGIAPDVEVQPTAEDFAEGRDPELLKAVELLRLGE